MLGRMRFRAERHSLAYPWHGLEDPDDLVQETFLHALRARSHLPLSSAKIPYLFAIARNLYIDRLRRRRQVSVELDPQIAEHASLHMEEREHELQECVERLARYAETLQPSMQLFYELRFVRGLSQRDTARELSASRRHVRTLERRLLSGAARALRGISSRDT
jgi:RNA polymerase sigma-70 factor (ECF subfamily)